MSRLMVHCIVFLPAPVVLLMTHLKFGPLAKLLPSLWPQLHQEANPRLHQAAEKPIGADASRLPQPLGPQLAAIQPERTFQKDVANDKSWQTARTLGSENA